MDDKTRNRMFRALLDYDGDVLGYCLHTNDTRVLDWLAKKRLIADGCYILKDGSAYWYKGGSINRGWDLPAVTYPNGYEA